MSSQSEIPAKMPMGKAIRPPARAVLRATEKMPVVSSARTAATPPKKRPIVAPMAKLIRAGSCIFLSNVLVSRWVFWLSELFICFEDGK